MFRRYYDAIFGFRRRAAWCIVLSIASGFAEALGIASVLPLLSGAFAERGAKTREYFGLGGDDLVVVGLVALVVLGLASALLRYLSDVAVVRLQSDMEESLRSRMTRALLGMAWPEYLHLSLGETGKSVLIEATQVGIGINYIVSGLGYCVVTAAFVVVAAVISPIMTGATLLFGAGMAFVYRAAGRRAGATSRNLSLESSELTETTTDLLGNAKFYRSTGLRDIAATRADSGYRAWRDLYFRVQRWPPTTRLVFDVAGLIFISGVLGITLVARNDSPLEPLVFLALFYRLAPKLQQAQQGLLGAQVQSSWWTTWKERFDDACAHGENATGRASLASAPTVVFDRVSYSFPGTDVAAVHDVSWELEPGACIGLVGESGGGKTTVLDLVTGLLTPTDGRVTLDGQDLREVDLEAWRQHIGFVMQDAPMFQGSILDNIAWGAELDRDRVARVADLAHLTDVVGAMADGLDTQIGQRGARLSGGQRQRVALARALYRDPWLLVLDEATSALDAESEEVVQEALVSLKGTCSMLVVAHRIATVRLADRILVLSGGRVAEDGGWDDLIAADGMFTRLASAQGIER